MNRIVKWWASNPVAANLLMIICLLGGLVSYIQIERELDPYVEFPGANTYVAWPGASPQDVEEQIIVRMEEALSEVDDINRMWAFAGEGGGSVTVVGKNGVDEAKLLADVKRKIDSINAFPPAAEEPQINIFRNRDEVIRLAVSGDETVSERELKRFAEKTRREIALLGYVPAVELFGVRGEEVSIEVSEATLRQYGLTLAEVATAIRGTSVNASSGNVRTDVGNMQLRTRRQADTQSDFENIIVRQDASGAVIRVKDIAEVIDGFEQVDLMATVNGKRTILVQIMSGPNMDILKMSENVRGYVEGLNQNIPEGITITEWDNAEDDYSGRISTIAKNFFMGLLLVCLTLMLFLRPKIALWVSVGIATAFAGGLALLPLFDVSFNMISTFAFLLVIGVIVDDAIIVGEAIHYKTEEGEVELDAAVGGTSMVVKPVIFAVLTTMIFFAPWMYLSGGTSEFTRAISLVVILALAFSLLESLLILPAHLAHLKPVNPKSRIMRFQNKISESLMWFARSVYRPLIIKALYYRYVTASIFIGFMILTVGLVTNGLVTSTFFPEGESDQIEIDVTLPEGTPYARTLEVLAQIQKAEHELQQEIKAKDGDLIENWYTRSRDNNVLALVKLVPPETRAMKVKDATERLRELIGDVPDAENININYQGGNNGPAIQYVLNAKEFEDLKPAAEDLMNHLRSYEGVFNVVNDMDSASDEIQFDLKPGAESLGITSADVARQVRQGFFGEEVQRLPRDGEDVRVYVRYPRIDRESLDFLKSIRIRTSDGRELPLEAVAELRYEKGTNRILRRERQRAIIVSAEVASERAEEIRKTLDEEFFNDFNTVHPNVTPGNIGRSQDEAEFQAELMTLMIIAILAAYVLVAISFKSYAEPILILFAAIPFCYCGMIIGHLLFGTPMSVLSILGMFAAAGVAVNDNLVLLDYVHRLRDKGMAGADALIEAGTRRFRPILLTSLTTFVGLFPLLMERSLQAQWLIPIAISLAFGVLFALFVTLFFVPALYGIGADIRRFFVYLINGKPREKFTA
ncbi:multidrug efflux pump subunit AcrB [Litorimonas taeanensis]|uniref:Multidrug efflux pump subunit AcrB n=1 Tax=Litorimonas taeanensis TaxID=568099 RepID=A0A420WLT2_9PROT|nr:efflux RND transporter permease subunit [Litorimonas taeanensis]RKQ71988.1 multidrug efflux pump subunit AcrB [Litorimonas taeanensis]